MSSKRKVATIAITVAALTFGTVGFASAFENKGKRISIANSSVKVTGVGGEKQGMQGMQGMQGAPGAHLDSLLAVLVTSGTLTQVQVDAIKKALTDSRVAADATRAAHQAAHQAAEVAEHAAREALIATTIGLDATVIKARLAAGESLSAIAGAKKDALIAVLVAEATKRIDAQATTAKAGLVDKITARISTTPGAGSSGGPEGGHGMQGMQGAPGAHLDSLLAVLVTSGTLTQVQVDAIKKALTDSRAAHQTAEVAEHAAREALIATTIGLDLTVIKARLAAGESLGAIAGAKKDALIAVLVAEATKRIDAAVTAGKLTAEQATTAKAGLVDKITARISTTPGAGFPGGPKGGHGQGMQGMKGGHGQGKMNRDRKGMGEKYP